MTSAELEAKVAELEARFEEDPLRQLARLLAQELVRYDPSLARATAPPAEPSAPPPNPELQRSRARELLREMRAARRKGA